jgi:hypothetical protein
MVSGKKAGTNAGQSWMAAIQGPGNDGAIQGVFKCLCEMDGPVREEAAWTHMCTTICSILVKSFGTYAKVFAHMCQQWWLGCP